MHDHDPITQTHHKLHIVFHDQERHTVLVQRPDAIRQLMAVPEKEPKKIGFRIREKQALYRAK